MTKSNATRRALLVSALAIVMCLAMLIGTTFAWFTDTASTGLNKIQAGNLDVKLSYKDENGDFKEVDTETKVFDETALWEPGHIEYAVLKAENAGTLALKYKLGINIVSEKGSISVTDKELKLSDYIMFAVIDSDASTTDRAALIAAAEAAGSKKLNEGYSAEDYLLKGENKTVTLAVWMPENVGNDANYKTGEAVPEINLGINVVATQHTHEEDSFGTDYDENAEYPQILAVGNASELTAAIRAAKPADTVKLTDNISASSRIVIKKTVNIDLNGYTLSGSANNTLQLQSDADVTVTDSSAAQTGKITNSFGRSAKPCTVYMKQYRNMKFTLLSGTIESSVNNRGACAISNGSGADCTVNIEGGKVIVPENDDIGCAIKAEKGMTLNISGGEITGGASGVRTATGSVTVITGGTVTAKDAEGRTDEYGTTYGLYVKGNSKVTVGALSAATKPTVEGIIIEFNSDAEIPDITLVKGDITNPVYCIEPQHKYPLIKLNIKADAPVTFKDNTARFFLKDGLKMVENGSAWTVTAE